MNTAASNDHEWTSVSRMRLPSTKYAVNTSRLQERVEVALERRAVGARSGDDDDALRRTPSAANPSSTRERRSPNMRVASSRMRTGCNAGMSVALTIDVSWNDAKPKMKLSAKHTPAGNATTSELHVMRPPTR